MNSEELPSCTQPRGKLGQFSLRGFIIFATLAAPLGAWLAVEGYHYIQDIRARASVTTPTEYVQCQATLTESQEATWDHHMGMEDPGRPIGTDGADPVVWFVVSKPAKHASRKVGILFRGSWGEDHVVESLASDKSSVFSFELPRNFFSGNYTIDYSAVKSFSRRSRVGGSYTVWICIGFAVILAVLYLRTIALRISKRRSLPLKS